MNDRHRYCPSGLPFVKRMKLTPKCFNGGQGSGVSKTAIVVLDTKTGDVEFAEITISGPRCKGHQDALDFINSWTNAGKASPVGHRSSGGWCPPWVTAPVRLVAGDVLEIWLGDLEPYPTGKRNEAPKRWLPVDSWLQGTASGSVTGFRGARAPRATQSADTPPQKPTADQEASATISATSGDDAPKETPLTKLSVEELRLRYVEVIGRDTSSTNKAYLVWKLREAAKGKIPIGPRQRTTVSLR